MKKHLPLFLILLVTLIVFWPVTNGEYLAGWDDDQQILNNTDVTNLNWQSIKNYFTTYYVASYQPLASLSFGVEYYLFGENAFVHHFTNLILHLLNILFLYFLLQRIFKQKPILALFITAIFALHPLQTEVVGWISTRSTLMCSGFFLLSCVSYINYLNKDAKRLRSLLLCVMLFVLALFTKAAAVTLPLVLLALDYFYKRPFALKVIVEKVPLLLGSVAIGLVSIDSRKVLDSIGDFSGYYSLIEKVSLSSYTLVFYFWKSISPGNLYTYYGYPMKSSEESFGLLFLLAPLALVLILVIIWYVYRKSTPQFKRQWIFGVAFFAINIGLVINFTPFGPTMAAERYMYLPIVGVYICLGLALSQLFKWPQGKTVAYVIMSMSLLFFTIKSRLQISIWETRVTLWENAIKNTNAVYPWMELGNQYQKKGNIDKAIEYYNGGVALNPFYTKVYYYRGLAIKAKGDKAYAKIDFERVIKSGGDKKGDAFYERGLLYEETNMLDSALVDYDSALVYNPSSPAMFRKAALTGSTQTGVGNQAILGQRILQMMSRSDSLVNTGALSEALEVLKNVLLLNPSMESALMSKGLIQSNQQDFIEAASTFSQLLEVHPENHRARLSRAFAYTQTKAFEKSISDYDYVLETEDELSGEVLYFRAIALLKVGRREEACNDIIKAIKLNYTAANQLSEQVCK